MVRGDRTKSSPHVPPGRAPGWADRQARSLQRPRNGSGTPGKGFDAHHGSMVWKAHPRRLARRTPRSCGRAGGPAAAWWQSTPRASRRATSPCGSNEPAWAGLGRLISALLSRAPRLGLPFTKQGGSVPPRRDGKYQGLKQPRRPEGRDLSLHPSGE